MAGTPVYDFNTSIVSILGFYLSLTSLLASFFFVHITNWYLRIVAASVSWDQVRSIEQGYAQWVDCLIKARVERSPQPFFIFLLFAIFLGTLAYFASELRSSNPINEELVYYLYRPGSIFLAVFYVVSIIYLIVGYAKVNTLVREITAQIVRGRP
jgi:hypothetical protein